MDEPPQTAHKNPLIGVVGVCASGKSTLIKALTNLGYQCRHIAQEHSYVQNMWERLTKPDILVYLEVSYPVTLCRKKLNWTEAEYQEQLRRLKYAREKAQIVIQTDTLTPEDLVQKVESELKNIINPLTLY